MRRSKQIKKVGYILSYSNELKKISIILGKQVTLKYVTEYLFVVQAETKEFYVFALPDFNFLNKYTAFAKKGHGQYFGSFTGKGWWLISERGDILTKKEYITIYPMTNGFYGVKENVLNPQGVPDTYMGCIDMLGNEVISLVYSNIQSLIRDLFLCSTTVKGVEIKIIVRAGNKKAIPYEIDSVICICEHTLAIKRKKGLWGFYSVEDRELSSFEWDSVNVIPDSKAIITRRGERYDLIACDETGVYILYRGAKCMKSNLKRALTYIESDKNSFIMSCTGDIVCELNEISVKDIKSSNTSCLVCTTTDGKSIGIKSDGTLFDFDSSYLVHIKTPGGSYFATGENIDTHDKVYDGDLNLIKNDGTLCTVRSGEYLNFENDGKVGLYDLGRKQLVVPKIYDMYAQKSANRGIFCLGSRVKENNHGYKTYYQVIRNGKTGVICVDEEFGTYEVSIKPEYDECNLHNYIDSDIVFMLKQKGKVYLADDKGEILTKGYDFIRSEGRGDCLIVRSGGVYKVIDLKGNVVSDVEYENIEDLHEKHKFV